MATTDSDTGHFLPGVLMADVAEVRENMFIPGQMARSMSERESEKPHGVKQWFPALTTL